MGLHVMYRAHAVPVVFALAAVCSAAAMAQAPAGAANTNGAVSGVVVERTTNATIPNVVVTLRSDSAPERSQQLTDSKGRFVFPDVTPGRYDLTAAKAGYADGMSTGVDPGFDLSIPVTIAPTQWLNDVRLVLMRPATISGTVVDERGEPIVGVFVRVLTTRRAAGHERLASGPFVKTDDRGAYRISGLAEGTYIVAVPSVQNAAPAETFADASSKASRAAARNGSVVQADGSNRLIVGAYPVLPRSDAASQAYPMTFYPAAMGTSEAASVSVRPGEDRTGIDVEMRPVTTRRVSGVLTGLLNLVSDQSLRLISTGLEGLGSGSETATALVAPNGGFTFLNVPEGRYTITAKRSVAELTYRPTPGSWFESLPMPPASSFGGFHTVNGAKAEYEQGDRNYWGRSSIEVHGRDLSDVVVTMQKATTLTGRFEWEAAGSPATSPRRLPSRPEPTDITAEPESGDLSLGIPIGRVNTDTATFSMAELLPARYFLRMSERYGAVVKSITWNGRDYTDAPFDATSGLDIADVVVTFTKRRAALTGVAMNGQSRAGRVAVIAFPAEPAGWADYGLRPRRIATAQTANDGSFAMRWLVAGDYLVVATDVARIDAWQDPKFLAAASKLATPLRVDWGEQKALSLQVREIK